MNPEILFLITARGGSKGVPGKNLKTIGGLSLVAFKAISAKRSKYCSRLVISTEDHDIQAEAKSLGVEVPFTRPKDLATDSARSDDVVLHTVDYFETVEKRRYDAIMLLEPASPFARPSDYDAAVELFIRTQASLVVGLKETGVNSIFVGTLGSDCKANKIVEKFSHKEVLRRQAFETEYTMNGALYLIGWEAFKKTERIYGDAENTYGHVMDRFYSAEIDAPIDLRFAEFLVESGEIDMAHWR